MTNIGFYHLRRTPLEKALPQLLRKALESGKKVVVRAGSEERINFLNIALWTTEPSSFLPHGSAKEGMAEKQPIWLTTGQDNPNKAKILISTDGVKSTDFLAFERCLEIFDGRDQEAVDLARTRWNFYKEAGCTLTYWQQTDGGRWEKINDL